MPIIYMRRRFECNVSMVCKASRYNANRIKMFLIVLAYLESLRTWSHYINDLNIYHIHAHFDLIERLNPKTNIHNIDRKRDIC